MLSRGRTPELQLRLACAGREVEFSDLSTGEVYFIGCIFRILLFEGLTHLLGSTKVVQSTLNLRTSTSQAAERPIELELKGSRTEDKSRQLITSR